MDYNDPNLIRQAADEQALTDFASRDLADFMSRHGDVDVGKLMDDPLFLRFSGSRLGREPMANLYEDFISVMSGGESGAPQVQQASQAQQTLPRQTLPRQQVAHQGQATPTGAPAASIAPAASGITDKPMLTPVQRNSLRDWNRSQPALAMSEQEYLSKR